MACSGQFDACEVDLFQLLYSKVIYILVIYNRTMENISYLLQIIIPKSIQKMFDMVLLILKNKIS